jgi:hypothetical protein
MNVIFKFKNYILPLIFYQQIHQHLFFWQNILSAIHSLRSYTFYRFCLKF